MTFRFLYEIFVGIISLFAIIIFGEKGMSVFALLALLPIIMRIKKFKADERETFLFYKGTQIIFTAIVFFIVIGFLFTELKFSDLLEIKKKPGLLLPVYL
ncbi:MAG: hypothetical protein DAHOPDDO_00022 [Ignavibacteriaceae bacterium]|nr:hypothetical protein [Ignavibacteriaceae bacterium]